MQRTAEREAERDSHCEGKRESALSLQHHEAEYRKAATLHLSRECHRSVKSFLMGWLPPKNDESVTKR
jgi:hypothetical protein